MVALVVEPRGMEISPLSQINIFNKTVSGVFKH